MLLSDPVDLIYISQVAYIYAVGVLKATKGIPRGSLSHGGDSRERRTGTSRVP